VEGEVRGSDAHGFGEVLLGQAALTSNDEGAEAVEADGMGQCGKGENNAFFIHEFNNT